eukprot:GFUD01005902.1.p1 GENE.GFUD01005902.1~~GFUD01005902.1.p1  ORF type:complete len:187 (-),score=36.61 GFUD01005902.1:207-767(-)
MCCPSAKAITLTLSITGLLLSLYALHVETQASKDPDYVALCDISQSMSCSKVFSSPYGRGFGLVGLLLGETHPTNQPNSVYGIIFYSTMMLAAFMTNKVVSTIQFYLSLVSVAGSLYLAYILYFILQEMCPVCVSTYVVNILLFITSWCKKRSLSATTMSTTSNSSWRGRSSSSTDSQSQAFKKFI